jgi:hypothetical protein
LGRDDEGETMTPERLAYLQFYGLIRYTEEQAKGRTTPRRRPPVTTWLLRLRELALANGSARAVPCPDCPAEA